MPIGGRDAILIETAASRLLIETAEVRAIGITEGTGGSGRVEIHVAGLAAPFFLDFKTAAEADERAAGIGAVCGFAPTAASRLRRAR